MFDLFRKNLEQRKKNNLYRKMALTEGLDFTSNDYLNLSSHPQIRKTMISDLERGLELSAKASRLLGGTNPHHIKAEQDLAQFLGRPGVLSFASGYQANLGLIPALAKDRVIFSDELNHASLIDGIRLSKSPCRVFRHNDLDHLEALLKKESQQKLIITESLFSMEGDFCPLKDMSGLAIKYKALMLVDEAHSTGLFGKNLSGQVSGLKQKEHIISTHTGGKALAGSGAFVGSSLLIKNYLINNCRSFIYSTAPSPLVMTQWMACLKVLKKESYRAVQLKQKALQLRKDLSLPHTQSPIIFIILKGPEESLNTAKKLRALGFFIQAIRAPTVPKNKQGLRIILHYNHTRQQLQKLSFHLKNILRLSSEKLSIH